MADEYIIHRGRGVVRIRLGRDGADVSDEGEEARAPIRGPLTGDSGEEEYAAPRRRASVQFLDLGTRLIAEAPFDYRELAPHLPLQYDTSPTVGRQYIGFRQPFLSSAQWDAIEAELLAGDPFGRTSTAGREMPNVLNTEYESPQGTVLFNFYGPLDASLHHEFPILAGENPYWEWKARAFPEADWSPNVTAHSLAPAAGRYMRKRKQVYTDARMFDGRFYFWLLRSTHTKITDLPVFTAPARHPDLAFPLRVFGVPEIWWPFEQSACRVQYQGDVVGLSAHMFGWAIVEEFGIHSTLRASAIPEPGIPAPEDWLSTLPVDALRTVRRETVWRTTGDGNTLTSGPTTVYTILDGVRPQPQSTIRDQAVNLARDQAVPVLGGPIINEQTVALRVTKLTRPVGRLIGALEMKGIVYYLWRAE